MSAVIIIPARMGSTRLKDKPLAVLDGKPLIVHVAEKAQSANIAPVIVATDHKDIKNAVEKIGVQAVLTPSDLASGSDRVFCALERFDPKERFDIIINLQGDLPFFDPAALEPLCREDEHFDIQTLAIPLLKAEHNDPNTVKVIFKDSVPKSKTTSKGSLFPSSPLPVIDFRRRIDAGRPLERHWHHVGVYAYMRPALKRFVTALPASREVAERLEQLRAFDLGLHIGAHALPSSNWLSIDTEDDLQKARSFLKKRDKPGLKAS